MISNSFAIDLSESVLFEIEWQFHCRILMGEEEANVALG